MTAWSPSTLVMDLVKLAHYWEKMRIPMNLATDSGANSPPVGAKRRWDFIIPPCGYHESSLILVSS